MKQRISAALAAAAVVLALAIGIPGCNRQEGGSPKPDTPEQARLRQDKQGE